MAKNSAGSCVWFLRKGFLHGLMWMHQKLRVIIRVIRGLLMNELVM